MSGIKTGNPGFVNPVDGKVYTVDPGAPDALSVNPIAESVDHGDMTVDATLKDLNKKTKITLGSYLSAATKGQVGSSTVSNKYSIDPSTEASLETSLRTQGYPSPLTPASGGNSQKFASGLPSSLSEDFSAFNQDDQKIKKGASNLNIPDGHTLLPDAAKATSPVLAYQNLAFEPNYRKSGNESTKFTVEDILSPAGKSDYKLLDYSTLQLFSAPAPFIPQATSLTQTLAKFVQKPKQLSLQYKNFFPVNTPEEINFSFDNLATLSKGDFPAELTAPENQNGGSIFAAPLINSYGKNYTILKVNSKSGLQKGKTVDSVQVDPKIPANPNGNSLLSKIVIENKEITNFDFLKSYIDSTLADNEFKPTLVFLDKGLNPLDPPKDLELKINDIPLGIEKGQYTGVIKDPVTINELQQKASDMTYGKASEGLTPSVAIKNKYAVSPPKDYSLEPRFAQITDSNSKSPPLLTDSSNDEFFVKRDQINPTSSDASLVDTGFFKGKNNPNQPYDGHNLLRKIDGTVSFADKFKGQNGRLGIHGSGLGESNYQPGGLVDGDDGLDELGAKTGTPVTADIDHPLFKYKNNGSASSVLSFGNNRWAARGRARGSFNPMLKLSDGTEVSHLRMAKIGTGLLQRASGEIPALTAGAPPGATGFDPTGNIAEAAALLPSVVQAGIAKVSNQGLLASDVLSHLITDPAYAEESPDALINIARGFIGNDESWGAAYSSVEPYDEPGSALGLGLTMIAMVLAINLLYSLFLVGTNERKSSRAPRPADSKNPPSYRDPQAKGKYIFVPPNSNSFMDFMPDPNEIFGLKKTNNNFAESVGYGVRAFFVGSEKADISFGELAAAVTGQLVDAVLGENSAVNANLVVCRTIVRSALVFAIAIDRMIRRFNASTVGGIKEVLNLLKVFRASKIVASLNVFATIGDALLDRKNALTRIAGPDGNTLEANETELMKAADNTIFKYGLKNVININSTAASLLATDVLDKTGLQRASVKKSRLSYASVTKDSKTELNYDATLSWSARRAPSLYLIPQNAEKLASISPSGYKELPDDANSKAFSIKSNKLKRIPNEIREQFEKMLDAEYVPFYFQDVRTNEIISFHAFLTSLTDDYSSSYDSVDGFGRVEPVKIYKGTTRKIGLSFVVASTSPDDFNHMWYKINKLLTLVYPQYTEGRTLASTSQNGQTYQFKAPFSQMIGASPLVRIRLGDLLRSNYSKFAAARLFGALDGDMALPRPVDAKRTPIDFEPDETEVRITKDTPPGTELKITPEIENRVTMQPIRGFIKSVKISPDNRIRDPEPGYVWVDVVGKPSTNTVRAENKRGNNISFDLDYTETFHLPISSLELTKEAKAKLQSSLIKPNASEALVEFLNPENNAIIKSFKSSGGKGLAGFIESMNFDWYNQTTWEDKAGYAAPKMCKVTLSFSPIHDISPGLDHHGFNRAPVYRVGDSD